jgi:hypothetical protein
VSARVVWRKLIWFSAQFVHEFALCTRTRAHVYAKPSDTMMMMMMWVQELNGINVYLSLILMFRFKVLKFVLKFRTQNNFKSHFCTNINPKSPHTVCTHTQTTVL